MPHEIETHTTDTGERLAAAVFARTPAWHRLGTVLDDTFTAEQAMAAAHLGAWDVRKIPVQGIDITDDGVDTIELAGQFMTVRTNPFTGRTEGLGIVGDWYHLIQNEEHAAFLDALVDGGAKFETAGSLSDGKRVFFTLKIPTTMTIGGVDPVDMFIAAINYHDGSGAFTCINTPIRVVCANTERAALNTAQQTWKVRHTRSATSTVAEARRGLDLAFAYATEFEAEAERMIQETLSAAQFRVLAKQVIREPGVVTNEAQDKRDAKKLDELTSLFTDAGTQAGIKGTRWAGYNALTEWADYFAPVQAKGVDLAEVRAARVINGAADDLKIRAFRAFRVPVSA